MVHELTGLHRYESKEDTLLTENFQKHPSVSRVGLARRQGVIFH